MFIIKRNQILIITLVVMVLLTGYLNYNDKKIEQEYLLNETMSVDLVPSNMIDDSKNSEEENDFEDYEDKSEIGVATLVEDTDNKFFIEAKLNRDETREERREWLMDVINTMAVSDDAKEGALTEIIDIQDRTEKENQAESLIESKGFGKTYIRIDDNSVDVVVAKQSLTQNEISQIADIVTRCTGYKISQIKISSLKEGE